MIPFRPEEYLHQPYEISLETLAMCNAACSFCPYPTLDRQGEKMSMELIEKLVAEMATFKLPFYFSPFKVNEPFLDKRVLPLCRMINENVPLAQLRLFTNGSTLTLDVIDKIAQLYNVEHLWISLNAVKTDEYEKVMKLSFARTAEKLDRLHDYYSPLFHPVVLSRVASRDNNDNLEFIRYCGERWPQFMPVIIKRDGWLGDIDAPVTLIPDRPCVRWWELSIMANGIISLCCMDGTGKFAIGDTKTDPMLEIYNRPAYSERREQMLSRKAMYPCATCSY